MAESTNIAVAVVQRDGQFLVGRRPAGVPLAGFAEFPGGKVKAGEAADEAAARECLEETGIEVEVMDLLATVEHEYPHGMLCLYFFSCRVARKATPCGTFRWVSPEELLQLEFPPANRKVLERLTGQSPD